MLIPAVSSAQVLEIEINQIEELSEEYSLEWQQLMNLLNHSIAGEVTSAARINPSLAYDLEFLDDGRQKQTQVSLQILSRD